MKKTTFYCFLVLLCLGLILIVSPSPSAASNPSLPGQIDDIDGDGRFDLTVWRTTNGGWYARLSSRGYAAGNASFYKKWGDGITDVPLLGDLDGDLKSDLIVWRATTGEWHALLSTRGYARNGPFYKKWGNGGTDIPLLGDLDGDRKSDLIVWRTTNGGWYALLSSRGYAAGNASFYKKWGDGTTDVPLLGDLDGDHKSDLIVWRATTGEWYALLSTRGYARNGPFYKKWGNGGTDIPLLGDLDGDRKSDLIVWRTTNGGWYALLSSRGYAAGNASFYKNWGNGDTDVPLLGDLDGDRKSDLIVWRTTTGEWFARLSSRGYAAGNARFYKRWGDGSIDFLPGTASNTPFGGSLVFTTFYESFDPSNVLSNNEFNDYGALIQGQVREFINHRGGPLKDRQFGGKPAYQIIYEAAINRNLNPKLLLVTLEKEQSLVTQWSTKWALSERLACATGCNAYISRNTGRCVIQNPNVGDTRGFSNQLTCAANTFRNRYNEGAQKSMPTWVTAYDWPNDRIQVHNAATYALYRYTPSVSDKRRLHTIWLNFWPDSGERSPAAPSNLRATPTDSTHIRLNWNDNSNNESGFRIYEGNTPVATVGTDTTSYTVSGLAPNSYHCYHMYAYNDHGNSAWTDWACATTPPQAEQYSATWDSQSGYPTVSQGGRADLWVKYRNTGNTTWHYSSPNRTLLGTLHPDSGAIDYHSPFVCSSWIGDNRPAVLEESSVGPGGIGTFRFPICVPSNMASGTYKLRVAPLVEGITWMRQSNVFWNVTVTPGSCPVYRAEYYNNRYLSGNPTFVQCENWPINHNWGNGGPGNGVGNDNFSARWTGRAHIAEGTYTFIARADDGIRVWIGSNLIIDEWHDQPPTEYRETRHISDGYYDIKVEYYENGGGAVAQFRWEEASTCDGPAISLNQTLSGNIGSSGEQDSYCLTVGGGQWVSIRMVGCPGWTTCGLDTYLEVYNLDGSRLAWDDDGFVSGQLHSFLSAWLPGAGTYRIVARGYGSTTGEYALRVESGRAAAVGDINKDCIVDGADASIMSSRYGSSDPEADLNLDGVVNSIDYSILQSNWGKTCTAGATQSAPVVNETKPTPASP